MCVCVCFTLRAWNAYLLAGGVFLSLDDAVWTMDLQSCFVRFLSSPGALLVVELLLMWGRFKCVCVCVCVCVFCGVCVCSL